MTKRIEQLAERFATATKTAQQVSQPVYANKGPGEGKLLYATSVYAVLLAAFKDAGIEPNGNQPTSTIQPDKVAAFDHAISRYSETLISDMRQLTDKLTHKDGKA